MRWKFVRVNSPRWARPPALDDQVYQQVGLTRSPSHQEVVTAFGAARQTMAAGEEGAIQVVSGLFEGGNWRGQRVVWWTILCNPILRELYHTVGYPLVPLLHAWLQQPDKRLSGLSVATLVTALVANERQGNSRAVRNHLCLLPSRGGGLPARYAAYLQGASLVLMREDPLFRAYIEELRPLEQEGSDADKAVWRYISQDRGVVGVALVPVVATCAWASVVWEPEAYYVGLRLPERTTRASVIYGWSASEMEDCLASAWTRGVPQREAETLRIKIWVPPSALGRPGDNDEVDVATEMLATVELQADGDPVLRPAKPIGMTGASWERAACETWKCV